MIEIKKAEPEQLMRLAEIERITYPPEEAASPEKFTFRLNQHPFWTRSARIGEEIVGFVCGIPVACDDGAGIDDAMYDMKAYPAGDTYAILSLAVDPAYQRQGIGELLMRTIIFLCREHGMKRIILACKEEKVHYYAKFGFQVMGRSESDHGGAVWYDMDMKL